MLLVVQIEWYKQVLPLILAVVLAAIVLEMIRRHRLREEYALLWLVAAVGMLLFAIFPKLIFYLQGALGVNYLTLMLMAGFFFLGVILLHFSAVISKQSDQIRRLAERMAIFDDELRQQRTGEGAEGGEGEATGSDQGLGKTAGDGEGATR